MRWWYNASGWNKMKFIPNFSVLLHPVPSGMKQKFCFWWEFCRSYSKESLCRLTDGLTSKPSDEMDWNAQRRKSKGQNKRKWKYCLLPQLHIITGATSENIFSTCSCRFITLWHSPSLMEIERSMER